MKHKEGNSEIADASSRVGKKYEQKLHSLTNSEAYAYDNIYRLTSYKVGTLSGNTVPSPTTQSSWNLDPVGNWNSKTTDGATETRSHNNANEISAINSTNLTHDPNGNLTADLTQAYTYDEDNRLVQVSVLGSPSSVLGSYSYDALGRRISKTTTNGSTCFIYDGARIIEEHDCTGNNLATYTYGNYIDEVLTKDTASTRYFYHQNTLWSVHAITEVSGAVVERYSYDAYGKPSFFDANGLGLQSSVVGNRFLFTGREYDFESDLYHYRARTYSPTLGRFLSRDPLSYVDGMNLYEYVRGQVLGKLDPTGRCKVGDIRNASCEVKLGTNLNHPNTDAMLDELLKAYADYEKFTSFLDWLKVAIGASISLEELLQAVAERLAEDSVSIDADAALRAYLKALKEGSGYFGGWQGYTGIFYEQCEPCCILFTCWTKHQHSSGWETVPGDIMDRFQDKFDAYKAGVKQCKSKLAAFIQAYPQTDPK
jgi:RHS repeat-associated protein